MKKNMYAPVLVMLLTAFSTLRAQDYQEEYLGLPGDNLNLYAVMKLFQESKTLEGFENRLNAEDSRINNLDLDGDGYVDYIRVVDNIDRNAHYIVLQVAINSRENQDVAVFTVLRENDGQVLVQLIGDEALYGRNYIIEPIFDEGGQTPNPGYMGNARTIDGQQVIVNRTTTVEIAAWPVVRFIYRPNYVVWHSPWYYSYYPSYWRPWSPFYWHYYQGYHYNNYHYYYGHYRHWDHYRSPYWHDTYYSSRRAYSPGVHNRIQTGYYKNTYSRPEQRREGVALYQKTQQNQNRRTSGQSSGSSTMRRSASDNGSGRQTTTTGTNRRSSGTGTSKQSTVTGTEGQSTTSGNRRSTSTTVKKESSTTGVSNTGRRSSSTQNATQNRSTEKSSTSGVSTSGRRSSGSSKPAATQQQTGKTEKSKTTNGTGRR